MTNRVAPEEVKAIMDNVTVPSIDMDTYILGANTLVNTALGTGDSPILKEIERWLAAHLIAITRERMALKEEAGTAKITYIGEYGKGLNSTPYGQMVMILDLTGKMANLMLKTASIYAIKSFK